MNPTLTKSRDVVLVVDDSPETLSMLNDVLDRGGLTVLVALEGSQALNIAANITPDIILLDAMMPNMDGFETCKALKKNPNLAHIPIIFMTGLSDTESVIKGLQAGGVDYITKPIKTDELIARMRVHLANARLAQSARTALDTAGQFLFASAGDGRVLWTTPQAQQLFAKSGATEQWTLTELPTALSSYLHDRGEQKMLRIDGLSKPVEVHFIGQSGADEWLFRLVDPERPTETAVLKQAFPLTDRETEVLLWISKGKTNREIAMILSTSPRTINKHLEQVFKKLGVENRTTAATMALQQLNRQEIQH